MPPDGQKDGLGTILGSVLSLVKLVIL